FVRVAGRSRRAFGPELDGARPRIIDRCFLLVGSRWRRDENRQGEKKRGGTYRLRNHKRVSSTRDKWIVCPIRRRGWHAAVDTCRECFGIAARSICVIEILINC